MKRTCTLMFFALQAVSVQAQTLTLKVTPKKTSLCNYACEQGSVDDIKQTCNLTRSKKLADYSAALQDPFQVFNELVALVEKSVLDASPFNYTFNACSQVCNACSLLDDEDRGVILFNPQFFNNAVSTTGDGRWKMLVL